MRSSTRSGGRGNSLFGGPSQSAGQTCHQCGKAYNKPTAKFCSHCGTKKLINPIPTAVSSKTTGRGHDGIGKSHDLLPGSPRMSLPPAPSRTHNTVSFTSSEKSSTDLKLPPAGTSNPNRRLTTSGGSPRDAVGSGSAPSSVRKEGTPLISPGLKLSFPKNMEAHTMKRSTSNASEGGGANSGRSSSGRGNSGGRSSPGIIPPVLSERESRSGSQVSIKEPKDVKMTLPPIKEQKSGERDLPPPEPKNLTPQMLMTENYEELAVWKKGTFIGRGTFGSVYLGLLADGSFYAVKCVELGRGIENVIDPAELLALHREITVMRQLKHPNLCEFKGVWYDSVSNHICMFMQYVGGGSLTSFVKKFKPLPPDVVRTWTKQLLNGLSYLHSKHIIHRDVKGENVLVDTSVDPSSGAQIKLVDFGAARRLTDAVSQSKTVIGTPYWMAPEVVKSGDGGGYSYKADVWSVGCTVSEMLTGSPPWPMRANAPATILMIATAKNGPTEIPEKEATPGCLDFMRKCFEINPEKRHSVDELLRHPWICGDME